MMLQIFVIDDLNDVDSHKDVPCWGLVDTAVHLMDHISPPTINLRISEIQDGGSRHLEKSR